MIKSRFFLKNDPVFLREFDERLNLQRSCIEKHLFVPPIVTLKVSLSSKAFGERVFFSNSYVRNFYNWLVSQCAGATSNIGGSSFGDGSLANKSVTGSTRSYSYYFFHSYYINEFAGTQGSMLGIVIGKSSIPFSFDHYNLQDIISSGTNTNQLVYNAPSSPTRTWDSETRLFTVHHERSFYNGSGSNVSVTEAGFRSTLYYTGSSSDTFLLLRDLLPETCIVPPEETLTLTYNFSITYPS
ncbi:MAG: hypothetical protein PHV30_10750 [Candidatus Margulisbacteria bacterium]|nr:hypothetical protein [Candidatus Margulisiibacteriota bacterium]